MIETNITKVTTKTKVGWAKLKTARELSSSALRADAYETIACAWMSATTLIGLLLNATLGWSWADPVAALLIVPLVLREGMEAIRDEEEDIEPDARHADSSS